MRAPDVGTGGPMAGGAVAPPARRTAALRQFVRPVVLAGVLAGLAFAGYSMVAFAVAGRGVWYPLNLVAHTLWHAVPTDGRFWPGGFVLGLATIVVMGTVVLVPFAALAYGAAMDRFQVVIGA